MTKAITFDAQAWTAANADPSSSAPPRFLHLVRVDGIEFIFWELEQALDKLAEEPEARFERITVH